MEVEEEKEAQLHQVWRALRALAYESALWESNMRMFENFSLTDKQWWWLYTQKMSKQGLPMSRTLVAKVIQLRMS